MSNQTLQSFGISTGIFNCDCSCDCKKYREKFMCMRCPPNAAVHRSTKISFLVATLCYWPWTWSQGNVRDLDHEVQEISIKKFMCMQCPTKRCGRWIYRNFQLWLLLRSWSKSKLRRYSILTKDFFRSSRSVWPHASALLLSINKASVSCKDCSSDLIFSFIFSTMSSPIWKQACTFHKKYEMQSWCKQNT